MELELIKVDLYEICGFFDHRVSPTSLFKGKGKQNKKM
jgi:hypothetical protein